ncbi:MAG: hypothetical protein ACRENP_11880 [Longimicrobiales bacterium]
MFRIDDWQIKVYTISQESLTVEPAYLDRCLAIAAATLPTPAVRQDRYGLGFAVIHRARMFNQIVIDWWERDNELRHRVFKAEADASLDFREITATGEAFCVWELRVLAFEREAWLDTVLSRAPAVRFDDYLARRLIEDA